MVFLIVVKAKRWPHCCVHLCRYGAVVCGVDQAQREGKTDKAAAHWPWRWCQRQHPQIRWRGRRRRRPGKMLRHTHTFYLAFPCLLTLCYDSSRCCVGLWPEPAAAARLLGAHHQQTTWCPQGGWTSHHPGVPVPYQTCCATPWGHWGFHPWGAFTGDTHITSRARGCFGALSSTFIQSDN